MDVAQQCPQPTLCWVFADREGHIGMQGGGWFPKRNPANSGLLPVAAWDEANHWQGQLESYYLPRIYDPPEGFIATANENINSPGDPMLVTQPLPDYRKRRIVERLKELPQATVTDMQKLQYDVVSLQARDLLAVFLPYLPDSPIKRRLAAWDCSYHPGSLEATLFTKLYRNVLLEIFGEAPNREGGGIGWRRMLYLSSRFGFSMMVLTSIDRLLKQDYSRWWAGKDKGELIRRAAAKLAGRARSALGRIQFFPVCQSIHQQQPRRAGAGIPHGNDADAGMSCHAVSRTFAHHGQARNDLCAVVSLCDRFGHRRGVDEFARAARRRAGFRRFIKAT